MTGKTTASGLGWEHQKRRVLALQLFIPGTPCRYCRRPMHRWQSLDLDHVVPRILGGMDGPTLLVHSKCNRRMGAILGNKLRGQRRRNVNRRLQKRW